MAPAFSARMIRSAARRAQTGIEPPRVPILAKTRAEGASLRRRGFAPDLGRTIIPDQHELRRPHRIESQKDHDPRRREWRWATELFDGLRGRGALDRAGRRFRVKKRGSPHRDTLIEFCAFAVTMPRVKSGAGS